VLAGELISVDGDRGIVARGDLALAEAGCDPAIARFLAWRDHQGGNGLPPKEVSPLLRPVARWY